MSSMELRTFQYVSNFSLGLRKLEAFFAVLISTMSITFGYMYVLLAGSFFILFL